MSSRATQRFRLALALVMMAGLLIPGLAAAQGKRPGCENLPPSIGPVPQELLELCGQQAPNPVPSAPTDLAFGWESVSNTLNSIVLNTPGVLNIVGGAAFGNFVGACDFFGDDFTQIYCLDGAATSANLFTVDTVTGAVSVVGNPAPFGSETFASLDYDPSTSTMYATSTNITTSSLYTINVGTAVATRIGALSGVAGIIAAGFDNAGQMFGFGIVSDAFFSIDKSNGNSTNVGALGFDANFGQGMDFDADDGTCYMFAFNNTSFQAELRICDPSNGSSSLVGGIGTTVPGGLNQFGGAGIAASGVPPVPTILFDGYTATDLCEDNQAQKNGIWEPGERIELSIDLSAITGDFTGIQGTISSASPGVTIEDATASWPDLADGDSGANIGDLAFRLDQDLGLCGSIIDIQLDVTSNEGGFGPFNMSDEVGLPLVPNVPLPIPDSPGPAAESDLVVGDDVTLNDVNVRVEISHSWVGDLIISLRAPDLSEVVLLDRPGIPVPGGAGCSDDNMDVTFDDASGFDPEQHCTGSDPWYVGDALPVGNLSDFNNMSSAGTWTLVVSDNAGADTGTIDSWELITDPPLSGTCELCTDTPGPGPGFDIAIPTLSEVGLVLMALLLALGAAVTLRRRA